MNINRSMTRSAIVGILAAGLSACGGGGGGGIRPTPPTPPTPPTLPTPPVPAVEAQDGIRSVGGEELEPSNPRNPVSWETREYELSNGLALINASAGYATRTTGRAGGSGITVAVLDDGVAHPDLLGGGFDAQVAFAGVHDRDHGTPVAGIIAARRNNSGTHGVAYNANLLSAETCGVAGGGIISCPQVSDSADEVAVMIASAAGLTQRYGSLKSNPKASSHIINMSFGWGNVADVPQITDAMRGAADAGRIMVAALGNCGSASARATNPACTANGGFDDGLGPSGAPASNVADAGIAGYAIAVGSLNADGTGRASHSNTCGSVRNYCLFAPGEGIYTTRKDGGYGTVSGTSFAAPHVSGAAAVVWAAFPNKKADQIVRRLLTTARPLDGQGISSIYGHGKLDLAAALSPVGFTSLSLNGGTQAPLVDTSVNLPPGFGAPSGASSLYDAVVYDEQMFPFLYDLTSVFHTAQTRSPDSALQDFLSSLGTSYSVSLAGRRASVHFVRDDEPSDARLDLADEVRDEEEVQDYRFNFNPVPELEVSVGHGADSIGASNGFVASRTNRAIFGNQLSVGPFAAFAGRGLGLSLDWRLDEDTSFDFAGKDGRGYFGSSSTRLASLGLTRRVHGNVTLGARYGTLRESDSVMGIRTTGAFTGVPDAATDFLDLSVEGRVSDSVTLFGSASHGNTAGGVPGEASLVAKWSGTRASSFVIGTEVERLWRDSDRLTVTASSPFRAQRATVHLDIPDREAADQVVRYSRRAVDLTPGGRERRLELVYETGPGLFDDRMSLVLGSYVRVDPGHDRDADTDFGAAAKLIVDF